MDRVGAWGVVEGGYVGVCSVGGVRGMGGVGGHGGDRCRGVVGCVCVGLCVWGVCVGLGVWGVCVGGCVWGGVVGGRGCMMYAVPSCSHRRSTKSKSAAGAPWEGAIGGGGLGSNETFIT